MRKYISSLSRTTYRNIHINENLILSNSQHLVISHEVRNVFIACTFTVKMLVRLCGNILADYLEIGYCGFYLAESISGVSIFMQSIYNLTLLPSYIWLIADLLYCMQGKDLKQIFTYMCTEQHSHKPVICRISQGK